VNHLNIREVRIAAFAQAFAYRVAAGDPKVALGNGVVKFKNDVVERLGGLPAQDELRRVGRCGVGQADEPQQDTQ